MWRSQARYLLSRAPFNNVSTKPHSLHKILISNLSSSPPPPPPPTPLQWISALQNPRFFSHAPETFDPSPDRDPDRSETADPISSEPADFDAGDGLSIAVEGNVALGENPDLFSQGSSDFDGNNGVFGADSLVVCSDYLARGFNAIGSEDQSLESENQGDGVAEVDSEQVESVASLLQSSLDGSLESRLDQMDLALSEEFVARVIGTPHILGDRLIGFFRWASAKPECPTSSRVVACLVDAIGVNCRKREVYSLWDLVKEFGEKERGLFNTKILNGLILLLLKLGKGKAGLEVFDKFGEFGCERNSDSYYLTVQALLKRSLFEDARSVCEKMIDSGRLPDEEKIGKLIDGLCRGGRAQDAYLVYKAASDKETLPPKSSVYFMVNKLCANDGTVYLAAEVLKDLSGEWRKYAIKPFSSVIRGLCSTKHFEEAKNLLHKMIDEGPPPGNAVFNFVISSLSKAGEVDESVKLMKLMESRGLRPDLYTYNAIVGGYANGGQMDDACGIFSEAKKKYSKLCPVLYHTLIRGFCKIEDFDKALNYFGEMKEYGVQPTADEYNKLIQSLCLKALDWQTAEKLLEEMQGSGLYLNGITRALINAVKELEAGEQQVELVSA